MRIQLNKLQRGHSTKAERIFGEILKSLRIPFRTKVKIDNMEIDFIVDKYAIEINGHEQSGIKNNKLIRLGYVPIHFNNRDIINNRELIKNKLCLLN